MKLTSSILLAFASTIIAAPTPIAPTLSPRQDAISNAINQWLTDINTVNNFLNTVFSSGDASGFAAIALQAAHNEPVQLGILTNLLTDNDSAGQANSANLMSKFGGVPTALQNIINGGDVAQNVAAINELRCGDVLPNIGALWQNVCQDNLVPVVAFPPGPFVCPFEGSTNSYQIV